MIQHPSELVQFLIEAKCSTYAGNGQHGPPWRPESKDLPYRRGDYLYIDTYLGGIDFIGEEAAWVLEEPVWGMNYYGCMLVENIPDGFGEFLKEALLRVSAEAPYRGPAHYSAGRFEYRCEWQGDLECFGGGERILWEGQEIYRLFFHGGRVR
jgi:hypothetical protein